MIKPKGNINMLRAGIVGLPNVGKSTLFNALTATKNAQSANYPFCTIEPNVGVVTAGRVHRLMHQQKLLNSRFFLLKSNV